MSYCHHSCGANVWANQNRSEILFQLLYQALSAEEHSKYRNNNVLNCEDPDITMKQLAHVFHPEDGSSMDLRNVGMLPQYYTASEPDDLDLNLHRRESPKSHYLLLSFPNIWILPHFEGFISFVLRSDDIPVHVYFSTSKHRSTYLPILDLSTSWNDQSWTPPPVNPMIGGWSLHGGKGPITCS
jgi:hypothetical protein